MATETATPTNGQIAVMIGMTHSGVSRIRSGARLPSLAKMRQIEAAFSWPLEQQVAARENGSYAETFGRRATAAVKSVSLDA